ncbi:MAG: protein translocase subunit SecF [Myxococcaceae bacterium]|nr:protein translocase subunit SecF [Myxococcaceae bacterium]
MQIIKHGTNIDFIGKRKPALLISTAINVAILVGIALFGLNLGVDFAGGTVVELKFNHPVSAEEVRRRATEGGLHDVQVQQIGAKEENSYLLRMGGVTQLTPENTVQVENALKGVGTVKLFNADQDNGLVNVRYEQKQDLQKLRSAVESLGIGVNDVRELGQAQSGGFDYQIVASGIADRIFSALGRGHLDDKGNPDFVKQRVDYVGPQVGKQLRNKGIMAVLYAMIAILVYVAFRFDFKFGPGALVAMVHDVIMVLGFYLVTRAEFNLTAIAALLTIVGYSVNDTIVVYDRVREEMARFKGKPLPEIINIAVNETLGRTILTSLTTALSVLGLLFFGLGEIRDFAGAMLVGIVVGTYSSVYIASPLTIWLDERAAAKAQRSKKGQTAAA